MDRSHSSSTKGAALQQRKYAERLLLLRIFQISSWQSLSEFQVTTFKYLGRCHEPLPPVYWVPSLLEIRARLELHQWFSRFGLVCIEGQIHTNPFAMYSYSVCIGVCIQNPKSIFTHVSTIHSYLKLKYRPSTHQYKRCLHKYRLNTKGCHSLVAMT